MNTINILDILKRIQKIINLNKKELNITHEIETTIMISGKNYRYDFVFDESNTFRCYIVDLKVKRGAMVDFFKSDLEKMEQNLKKSYSQHKI